jgi:hypothetical protein
MRVQALCASVVQEPLNSTKTNNAQCLRPPAQIPKTTSTTSRPQTVPRRSPVAPRRQLTFVPQTMTRTAPTDARTTPSRTRSRRRPTRTRPSNKSGDCRVRVSCVLTRRFSRQREALWASFQASVSTPPSHSGGDGKGDTSVRRVTIAKTYLFAGKHITYVFTPLSFFVSSSHTALALTFVVYARASTFSREVVEVAEGSEEATKWPRARPTSNAVSALASSSTPCASEGEEEGKGDSPAPPVSTSTPGAKRPGPRRPRTALPSLPKASQAKKITTLDKSAMDWRAHVASQSGDVKGELDANRRGGGYLEKVDFLKRVEDRREDAFEASKSSKRRKT